MESFNVDDVGDEVKAKALACKTPEDILELAKSEGVSLSMDELEGVSGGWCDNPCADKVLPGPLQAQVQDRKVPENLIDGEGESLHDTG